MQAVVSTQDKIFPVWFILIFINLIMQVSFTKVLLQKSGNLYLQILVALCAFTATLASPSGLGLGLGLGLGGTVLSTGVVPGIATGAVLAPAISTGAVIAPGVATGAIVGAAKTTGKQFSSQSSKYYLSPSYFLMFH